MVINGAILGRFQVFHNGHMRYLNESLKRCDHLIIGITNPDPLKTKKTDTAIHRSELSSNPLSYYERMKMIQAVCEAAEIHKSVFDIVPVPLDYPEYIHYYVPKYYRIFLTVHDQWSEEKKSRLEGQGYSVEVVIDEYGKPKLSSSTIRKMIAFGEDYSSLVPKSVLDYLQNNMLEEKISASFYC